MKQRKPWSLVQWTVYFVCVGAIFVLLGAIVAYTNNPIYVVAVSAFQPAFHGGIVTVTIYRASPTLYVITGPGIGVNGTMQADLLKMNIGSCLILQIQPSSLHLASISASMMNVNHIEDCHG